MSVLVDRGNLLKHQIVIRLSSGDTKAPFNPTSGPRTRVQHFRAHLSHVYRRGPSNAGTCNDIGAYVMT